MAPRQKTIPNRNARIAAMLRGPRSKAGVTADLLMAQAEFEITGNPLFAWRAMWSCLASRVDLPAWLRDYFLGVADTMKLLSTKDSITEKEKLPRAIKALGFHNQGHAFNRFDAARSGLDLTSLVAISKHSGKPDADFAYHGEPINQKRLAARAAAGGTVSASTAEERMRLGNAIRERFEELVKARLTKVRKKRS